MPRIRKWLIICTVVRLVWGGWSGAAVWAETVGCTAINSIPFTITTPGIYCMTQEIETNLANGTAIQIDASHVVLDLNGHRLGNLLAGPGTNATGIHAEDRKNITIKNGTVRGFALGISLEGGANSGHIVEGIRADLNTRIGIDAEGTGIVIRNNLIVGTGGANADVIGIHVDGTENRVLNNQVVNTVAVGTNNAFAISVENGSAVVDRNRVSNADLPSGGGSSYGIFIAAGGTNVLVVDNRITTMTFGVFYNGSSGKYGRNLTTGVTTPFSGGTASGGNND